MNRNRILLVAQDKEGAGEQEQHGGRPCGNPGGSAGPGKADRRGS